MSSEFPPNGSRYRRGAYWAGGALALVLIGKLCSLTLMRAELDRKAPRTERCVIRSGNPKMIPVGVQTGEWLEVFVDVESGDAVDILFGRDVSFEDKISIKDASLPKGKQTKHFQVSEKWTHASPAVVIVTSQGASDVTIRASVK